MKISDREKVKALIIEANKELEAHNFLRANEICEEAAELDYSNPNIYLIQLLARYEVTEIEDLQNCNVNIYSNYYKKVRLYAGKELNDELDKYIPKNVGLYPENSNVIHLDVLLADFFRPIKDYIYEILVINKELSIIKPEEDENKDSYASVTTFIVFVSLSLIIVAYGFGLMMLLFEGPIYKIFIVAYLAFTFIYPLQKIYKKDVINLEFPKFNIRFFSIYFFQILLSVVFYLISFLFYAAALGGAFKLEIIIPLLLAIIPVPLIITLYKMVYCIISNTNYFITKSISSFKNKLK